MVFEPNERPLFPKSRNLWLSPKSGISKGHNSIKSQYIFFLFIFVYYSVTVILEIKTKLFLLLNGNLHSKPNTKRGITLTKHINGFSFQSCSLPIRPNLFKLLNWNQSFLWNPVRMSERRNQGQASSTHTDYTNVSRSTHNSK